jgi:hypothetical protein
MIVEHINLGTKEKEMIDPKMAREDNDSERKEMAMTSKSQFEKGTVEITVQYLDALRRAVGLQIDPETAEFEWVHAQTLDPYGDYPVLPEEYQQIGREYFARSPGSDIWIAFRDLPEATRNALSGKRMPSLSIGRHRQHSP